ncbi:MAG: hypothetical protein JXR36_11415 [Bacteroidales bacterium]|nr:hypothetical protein [Bacteroidales bacterium]
MKNRIIITALTILLLLSQVFYSCKKEGDDPEANNPIITQSTFGFMKTGTKWTYNTFDSEDPTIVIDEVFEITEMGTDGWAKVKWSIAGIVIQNVDWYSDNSVFCNLAQKNTVKKLSLCTTNPAINDTWSETWDTSNGNVTNTRTVTALNQSVTVPAGTFNCIKIRETTSEDNIYYTDYWFNVQNGIIKTEGTTAEDYPTILYSELRTIQIP